MMGNLSRSFSRHEFACKCGCGQDTIDYQVVAWLQQIRDHFGAVVVVNSGNRCEAYNAKVGGSVNSQHKLSRAADIQVKGVHPNEVADYAESMINAKGGIGRYDTFTHIDSRGHMARWDNRSG